MASRFDATGLSPVMTVTVFPLRRFSRLTRAGWSLGNRTAPESLRGQAHCATGFSHTPQVLLRLVALAGQVADDAIREVPHLPLCE